jgi:23S rRNA (guanosine2251-2'-O)-methyltransferase
VLLLDDKNSILEVLGVHPEQVKRIWVEAGHERTADRVLQQARRLGVSFRVLPREEFARRFKGIRSHICLEREDFSYREPDELVRQIHSMQRPFLGAFDGISDPQNLGNALRTAACFGMDAVIIPKDRSCGVTETVSSIARGATEHIAVAQVNNLHTYLEIIKKENVFCFGLDERSDKSLSELDLTIPLCLVFGREEGMRRLTRETCDEIARIPTATNFASLNVATCFAIAAYEVVRQRSQQAGGRSEKLSVISEQ